ncbi:MAG TPA: inositol monophosphatase family protein [Spirochaetia bacterium]|nr:inositol monophosphatase family protein [Spirochaetia bacterium]
MSGTAEVIAPSTLRRLAAEAATAAGAEVRATLRRQSPAEHVSDHDVKLRLDRACEQTILGMIRAVCPEHAVLSEESGFSPGTEPFLWIVDPLDGTVNFHHGIPFYCVSVACYAVEEAEPRAGLRHPLPDGRFLGSGLAGVVYDPVRDELFSGTAGRGASLNEAPLRVPAAARLQESLVALSFGAREESIDYIGAALPGFIRMARKVRSFGSTALDMVQVAAGRVGAFVQMGTNLWDFAGAAVILAAAGGIVDVREYEPDRFRIIAAAAGLFDEVRRIAEGRPSR